MTPTTRIATLLGTVLLLLGVLFSPTAPAAEGPAAEHILAATGVQGGLIVHVGCGDGRLTAALRSSDSFLVHGLDTNADHVEQARVTLQPGQAVVHGEVSEDRVRELIQQAGFQPR